jgi:hypothetical protein
MTDDLDSVDTLITNGWTSANTDSITPGIAVIYELNRIDLGANADKIYIYESGFTSKENAFGAVSEQSVRRVSIDLRTTGAVSAVSAKDHFDKMKTELKRVLNNNIKSPFTGVDVMQIVSGQNLSNRQTKIYRYVYDVELRRFNTTIP